MGKREYQIHDAFAVPAHSTDSTEAHFAALARLKGHGYTVGRARGDTVQIHDATAADILRVLRPEHKPKSVNDLVNELARRVWEEQGVTIESVSFCWVRAMSGDASLVSSEVTVGGRG